MRQALTIDKAIKIFKEPGRVGYEPLQKITVEATQYNYDPAEESMEVIREINSILGIKDE